MLCFILCDMSDIQRQGLLTDGVLAWRCYILYGSQKWMKALLSFAFLVVGGQ
jgi:hypothetical protein